MREPIRCRDRISRSVFLRLQHLFNRMHLRGKLIVSFSMLIFAVCALLAALMIHVITGDMTDFASLSIYSIVAQNNRVLDSMFRQYEDSSTYMLANHVLFDFFKEYGSMDFTKIYTSDGTINPAMGSYFNQDSLYSCHLYTDQYVFGSTTDPAGVDSLQTSGLIRTARQAAGAPVWVAGYDYGKQYGIKYLAGRKNYPYKYLITMVRQMNFSYVDHGIYYSLPASATPPVLILNISESTLRGVYTKDFPYKKYIYLIFNSDGMVVSCNDSQISPAQKAPKEFLACQGKTGYFTQTLKGKRYLFCYDSLSRVGWTSVSAVPLSEVVAKTMQHVEEALFAASVMLLIVALSLSVLLSIGITRPINRTTAAVRRFAQGDFNARISKSGGADFQELAVTFNYMVEEIDDLIQENYQSAMREKEAQINMLTMQINPHFLYNTLNSLSMLSLENGDEKTSRLIVGLSQMINYASRNHCDTASLRDEAQWLNNYMAIMQLRYEGVFQYRLQIPETLYDREVPKFVLQPFLENSIVHGFADRETGGMIWVDACQKADRLILRIWDNGCGFPAAEGMRSAAASPHHIGIKNVRERIRLLYGADYGVTVQSGFGHGTDVTIVLPNRPSTPGTGRPDGTQ